MEKLSFQVADYDAPLGLILQLLQKHKLNILDIDISSLLTQYLGQIEQWQRQDLEVTSEFLEMASHLVYIKTVSLLPRHEEEHEQLRRELSGRLIEYRLCRLAAEQLGGQDQTGSLFVRRPEPVEPDYTYTLTHPASVLYAALADALGKEGRRLPPPREVFDPLVTRPVVSVTSKIFSVLRSLRRTGRAQLDRLFLSNTSRSGIVATFLALLELVKGGKVALEGDQVLLMRRGSP